ncbi:SigB/SigF/SigG family RNA polymerase sigma factor [Streptomyces radicis]|uniref:SigB/SigF/SigG family RNA polymerase sigma factor n=1 Tax=Streptomyces radicis TaxID=1750517 RepID=A0A3A9VY57_9ACTN|nr:SigB/SigF/SigG family RNA polymerase sigma factor [Streptomyces radicis]RKN05669.1 SigB/SigF/SigG family RNA polymerase sigma factor [Streptomyces radicis]RKN17508.1 SigB/SigF/SigG family RNA polymerase sigma factor [Streptomyces radicis]
MPATPVKRSGRKHPHHDAPDTRAAFLRLAEMPTGREKNALRERVVRAWMPMATRLARQYRNRGESLEDLEQVAYLGLVKAVTRYDPSLGTAFESYAVPTIVGEIKRHFRDHLWGMHVPRRVQELRNRVRVARNELSTTPDGRGPGVEEIAERANMTPKEAKDGLEALNSYTVLSLDAELSGTQDGGYSLLDTLGRTEPGYDRVVDREAVRTRLRQLPEREQQILYLRFFRGMTQSGIAERIGISQMHVSRLLTRTCSRLRQEVEAGGAG